MSGLAGKRILVTRAAEDRGTLDDLLRERGAIPVAMPCVAFAEAPEAARIADILRHDRPEVVAIASAHVARRLWQALRDAGVDPLAALAGVRMAAAGKGTAQVLAELGRADAILPTEAVGAEALIAVLAPLARGRLVLVPRSDAGNPALVEGLRRAGARVEAVTLYRTVVPEAADPAVLDELGAGRIAAIAFASGSAARGFAQLAGADAARRSKVVCMGASCAEAARAAGIAVDAQAEGGFRELCDALDGVFHHQ